MNRSHARFFLLLFCYVFTETFPVFGRQIKVGDTLSALALSATKQNPYGPSGSIKTLLKLNPKISNPDLIFVGRQIILPGLEQADKAKSVSESLGTVSSAKVAPDSFASRRRTLTQISGLPTSENERILGENTDETSERAVSLRTNDKLDEGVERMGHSVLKLQPLFAYSRIDGLDPANGSRAVLLSKLIIGLDGFWIQNLSENFSLFLTLGFRRWENEESLDPTIPIQNRVSVLPRFGAGLETHLDRQWTLGGALTMSSELYYRGTSAVGGITFDTIAIPEISLWESFVFLRWNPFQITGELKEIFLAPASNSDYTTNFSPGVQAKIEIAQNFSKFSFGGGLYFREQWQNSSIVATSRHELGMQLSLSWRPVETETATSLSTKGQ